MRKKAGDGSGEDRELVQIRNPGVRQHWIDEKETSDGPQTQICICHRENWKSNH